VREEEGWERYQGRKGWGGGGKCRRRRSMEGWGERWEGSGKDIRKEREGETDIADKNYKMHRNIIIQVVTKFLFIMQ